MNLIIDDGVPDRGHRTNIFNPEFKTVGLFLGEHKDLEYITVMDFSGGFVLKGSEDPIEKQMKQFLEEQVELDTPEGTLSWKQNVKVNV